MFRAGWAKLGLRLRDAIAWLTLGSHLVVAFGFPLPAPRQQSQDASRPFPCQNHPCACLNAEQCWQGDCCCYTLEEKLAWAEANGIEPPAHVRPLIAARKSHPPPAKKKSCCSKAPATSEPVPKCCERKKPAPQQPAVRWVIGFAHQKCRGEGPAGLLQLAPTVVADTNPIPLAEPECVGHVAPRSDRFSSLSDPPRTPPPRCC
jgi:hypothetical protein